MLLQSGRTVLSAWVRTIDKTGLPGMCRLSRELRKNVMFVIKGRNW